MFDSPFTDCRMIVKISLHSVNSSTFAVNWHYRSIATHSLSILYARRNYIDTTRMRTNTNSPSLTNLHTSVADAASRYYRLVLLVGPSGAGKTPLLKALSEEDGAPYLNVNLALSERLLPLTLKQRPLRVHRLLAEILDAQPAPVVCLDNIELLFDPSLHQDPLLCLQGLSRNKTLVVAWGGQFEGTVLSYAEPGHPEYRRYEHPDAIVFLAT